MTRSSPKPIYLLADSRVLFSVEDGRSLLHVIRDAAECERPSAAYVGAANGDDPAYFSIFEAAMDLAGVHSRRMIRADYPHGDATFLESADIIVLAGGDVRRGWRTMSATPLAKVLRERYMAGAVLVGISAGAILLGERGWGGDDAPDAEVFEALRLVPWTVDTHDEANTWNRLKRMVSECGSGSRGLGLPAGSGLVFHADMSIEPIRRSVVEVLPTEGDGVEILLAPVRVSGASLGRPRTLGD